jgi:hypothetical protein
VLAPFFYFACQPGAALAGAAPCEHHGNSCIPHQLELPTRCDSLTMSFARSFARNKPLNFFVAIV